MLTTIKIKNSDMLRQVLDQVNLIELRFYNEDISELITLLNITSIHSQRVKTITTFIDKKSEKLMNIEGWCQYKPQNLSLTVFNELEKSLKTEDENFILSGEQLLNYTGEKSYPSTIASITVLFRILTKLNKLLVDEKKLVVQEPQVDYKISTTTKHSSPLKWKESDTAFIELFASVFHVDAIIHVSHVITRKEMFEILAEMFNLNIKDLESKLSRAKRRKKNETPFLDSLRFAFINLCSRKTSR